MDIIAAVNEHTFTAILVFVLTFLVVYYTTRRRAGVPPGPVIPVFGNLLSLAGKDFFGQLERLRHRYGDIFGLYIGSELTIFLDGFDVIHDALIKKGSLFISRPNSKFYKLVIKEPVIVFENGSLWKERRLFTQSALQQLCFKNGGQKMESYINSEGVELVNAIRRRYEPFDIDEYTIITSANVISQFLLRHRFEHGDKEIFRIMKLISKTGSNILRLHLFSNCFPYLFNLPVDVFGLEKFHRGVNDIYEGLKPYLELTKDNHDSLVGMYQTHLEEAEQKDDGNDSDLIQFDILKMCFEIIGTGSDTTATTIRWIVLYLVRNPDIQDRLFQEINRELGTEQLPCLDDKSRLPYVHATTLEALRIANVAPLAVPHSPSRDLIFRGYLFPRNCTVIVNLNSALKDPKVWKEPEIFRPERFLNKDHTEVGIPRDFIPFSLGPRSCLGETLARSELFLLTTILFQNFKFYPEIEGEIPSIEGILGQAWNPKPFKVTARSRM